MKRVTTLLFAAGALAACQDRAPADAGGDPGANFSLNAGGTMPPDNGPPDNAMAGVADPAADEAAIRAVIDRIYAPYAAADRPARDAGPFFTADMVPVMRRAAGELDFDPFLGAASATPFTPTVGAVTVNGDSATVAVTYTQQRPNPRRDRPPIQELRRVQFSFARAAADWGTSRGWKIADIGSPAAPSLRRALGLREARR